MIGSALQVLGYINDRPRSQYVIERIGDKWKCIYARNATTTIEELFADAKKELSKQYQNLSEKQIENLVDIVKKSRWRDEWNFDFFVKTLTENPETIEPIHETCQKVHSWSQQVLSKELNRLGHPVPEIDVAKDTPAYWKLGQRFFDAHSSDQESILQWVSRSIGEKVTDWNPEKLARLNKKQREWIEFLFRVEDQNLFTALAEYAAVCPENKILADIASTFEYSSKEFIPLLQWAKAHPKKIKGMHVLIHFKQYLQMSPQALAYFADHYKYRSNLELPSPRVIELIAAHKELQKKKIVAPLYMLPEEIVAAAEGSEAVRKALSKGYNNTIETYLWIRNPHLAALLSQIKNTHLLPKDSLKRYAEHPRYEEISEAYAQLGAAFEFNTLEFVLTLVEQNKIDETIAIGRFLSGKISDHDAQIMSGLLKLDPLFEQLIEKIAENYGVKPTWKELTDLDPVVKSDLRQIIFLFFTDPGYASGILKIVLKDPISPVIGAFIYEKQIDERKKIIDELKDADKGFIRNVAQLYVKRYYRLSEILAKLRGQVKASSREKTFEEKCVEYPFLKQLHEWTGRGLLLEQIEQNPKAFVPLLQQLPWDKINKARVAFWIGKYMKQYPRSEFEKFINANADNIEAALAKKYFTSTEDVELPLDAKVDQDWPARFDLDITDERPFENNLGIALAKELIDEQGKLRVGLFDHVLKLPILTKITETGGQTGEYIAGILKSLRYPSLISLLESVEAPLQSDGPSANMVRKVCGLSPGEPVNSKQARIAVLSALLTRPRQIGFGSCFAISVVIRLRSTKQGLEKSLKHYIELIRDGYVERRGTHYQLTESSSLLFSEEVLLSNMGISKGKKWWSDKPEDIDTLQYKSFEDWYVYERPVDVDGFDHEKLCDISREQFQKFCVKVMDFEVKNPDSRNEFGVIRLKRLDTGAWVDTIEQYKDLCVDCLEKALKVTITADWEKARIPFLLEQFRAELDAKQFWKKPGSKERHPWFETMAGNSLDVENTYFGTGYEDYHFEINKPEDLLARVLEFVMALPDTAIKQLNDNPETLYGLTMPRHALNLRLSSWLPYVNRSEQLSLDLTPKLPLAIDAKQKKMFLKQVKGDNSGHLPNWLKKPFVVAMKKLGDSAKTFEEYGALALKVLEEQLLENPKRDQIGALECALHKQIPQALPHIIFADLNWNTPQFRNLYLAFGKNLLTGQIEVYIIQKNGENRRLLSTDLLTGLSGGAGYRGIWLFKTQDIR